MNGAERLRRVMELFEALVELPPELRAARLQELCPNHPNLRAEVEAMLAADAAVSTPMTAGGGFEALARIGTGALVQGDAAVEDVARLSVLSGQYRILRRIGEGGMGVVYEAEQALPRRRVALKAIRAGFTSRQVLRRFEQEAHILGRLSHPGIAQVFEAGLGDRAQGEQAFIVMELVDGAPLGEWARGRSPREKAALVARLCDAVQHAHQRRVVHRDLKPANVLVDRAGAPRILDFGVALLAGDEGALETRTGQLVGTLPYMSPEQVSGDRVEVDARADVYALGVILYELLAGRLPIPPAGRALAEMALAIRDEEPPRLGRLDRALRGDLEAIAAKALHKDRERRYQSALELGEELARWLAGEPVRARGDSALYVARRALRRHRWLALASGLALASLVAFAVTAHLASRRLARSGRELAAALRASRIELGRSLARSGNLTGAEELIWDAHLGRADEQSRWALWDLYRHIPCGRAFSGHSDAVLAMALSPRGDLLATGAHDGTVRLWDWELGECRSVHPLAGFNAGVVFTPDGARVCAADAAGALVCWDVRDGAELWRASEPVLPRVLDLQAAAGRPLAACVGEREACALVELETGRVVRRVELAGASWTAVALDRAGRRLALGGADGSIHLFEVDGGAALARFDGAHPAPVVGLAFGPDDGELTSCDRGGRVRSRALATGELTRRLDSASAPVRSLALAAVGGRVLLEGPSGAEVWELGREAPPDARPLWRQMAAAACFTPDPTRVVSDSAGGALRVWDVEPPSYLRTLPLRLERGATLGFTPGVAGVVRRAGPGRLELVDLEGRVTDAFAVEGERIDRVHFEPRGELLAVMTGQREISMRELPGGRSRCELRFEAGIESLRLAPDGGALAVSLSNGELRLHDAESGETRFAVIEPAGSAQRLRFSDDGRRLASSHTGNQIDLRDAHTGALERSLVGPHPVYSLCFEPEGGLLYAGTWDGRIQLWECSSGRLLRTLEAHPRMVEAIAFRPGTRVAASSGGDGLLRLWSLESSACLLTLDAQAGPVLTFGFDESGELLRAVHADGSVREWDLGCFERYVAGNEAHQRARRGLPARAQVAR